MDLEQGRGRMRVTPVRVQRGGVAKECIATHSIEHQTKEASKRRGVVKGTYSSQ